MPSVRPLNPALAETAREELGETPEALALGIQHLKDWIQSQSHLRARTDDQWLAAFLRGCKFRLDQAKVKIDLYYSLRSTAPDLYTLKYNDPKFHDVLELGAVITLPHTYSPAAPRINILRIGTYNPKEYTAVEIMTIYQFLNQIHFMEDDNLTVAGIINILDLRNTVFAHYTQTSYKLTRNLIRANQDALPVRIKQVHVIGAPHIFTTFMNIFKKVLSEKIRNRFHMHNDVDALHDYIPRELLPEEYGGTGNSLREIKDHWKQKVMDYRGFFEDDLQYGSDEELRGIRMQGKINQLVLIKPNKQPFYFQI
ncbi:alpha-tocopherol transfer protein-like [Aricia agestis]|uniref:alpha-tocopherol transfer protein-like n=1 Tax=Aricia agestis TaxID=91739 RepID=UPI001C201BC9|nr:alpha-tocopherol transfer protein-like [Aricia agestis]